MKIIWKTNYFPVIVYRLFYTFGKWKKKNTNKCLKKSKCQLDLNWVMAIKYLLQKIQTKMFLSGLTCVQNIRSVGNVVTK